MRRGEMDKILEEIIKLASKREDMYVKGGSDIWDVPRKAVELGIFLITSSKRMSSLKGDELRGELNAVQNKVDDFRKIIFQKKIEKL